LRHLSLHVYCQAAKSDGGWTLEMDDLRSVLEDAFGIDVKEDTEMLQRLFSTMDVNGDGVVTQDEWVSDSRPCTHQTLRPQD
jgi:Ca2+-binding EF-hand superfamily protein